MRRCTIVWYPSAAVIGNQRTVREDRAFDALEAALLAARDGSVERMHLESPDGRVLRAYRWDPSTNAEGDTIGWVLEGRAA